MHDSHSKCLPTILLTTQHIINISIETSAGKDVYHVPTKSSQLADDDGFVSISAPDGFPSVGLGVDIGIKWPGLHPKGIRFTTMCAGLLVNTQA